MIKSNSTLQKLPTHIYEHFPSDDLPATLRYLGREWAVMFNGKCKPITFDRLGWKQFVEDNEVAVVYLSYCSQTSLLSSKLAS